MLDLDKLTGHTPGPWKDHQEKGSHPNKYVTGTKEPADFPGDKYLVAYIVGIDSEANARLIAAAPELLKEAIRFRACLKSVLEDLETLKEIDDLDERDSELSNIRSIIRICLG
jgi:hypothetical protein